MRGRGEGTVYERKDGTWEGKISLGVDRTTGLRIRRSAYGSSKGEVLKALAVLRLEAGVGYLTDANLTVGEFLERWLTDYVVKNVRYKTHKSYRETVANYITPAIGHVRMTDLRPTTMDSLQAATKKLRYVGKGGVERVGVPAASAHYACVVFKMAIKWAAAKEVIPRNPFSDVRFKAPARKRAKEFTLEEARKVCAAAEARGDRLWPLYTLAIYTGLRHGELLALRWTDIDFEAGTMRVAGTLQERSVDGATVFAVEPVKSKAGEAVMELPAAAIAALKKHRALEFGRGMREFVFLTRNRTHYLQSNVLKHFHDSCAAAGVPRIRVHDLRHTCATLLLEGGESLERISVQLRHSDAAVSQRYAHVTAKVRRSTADRMDALMAGRDE